MVDIKKKRQAMKLSQEKFAEQLGVTQGIVSQWENGISSPTSERLPSIAKVLKCTIDDLFEE